MNNSSLKTLMIFVAIVLIGFLAYGALTMKDNRNTTDRIGDAVKELPNGVGAASRELEDRTPGQRLGDAVKDTGEDIKKDTAPSQ